VSKPLTVEALSHPAFSFVGFNSDDGMTEVGQFKYFGRLLIACESHQEERDIISMEVTFSFWSGGLHLSHTNDIEAHCQ